MKTKIKLDNKNFTLNEHEIEILKKISEWPKCVAISSNKLEPHRVPFYLYELVSLFHSYWNLGNENKEVLSNTTVYKFDNQKSLKFKLFRDKFGSDDELFCLSGNNLE